MMLQAEVEETKDGRVHPSLGSSQMVPSETVHMAQRVLPTWASAEAAWEAQGPRAQGSGGVVTSPLVSAVLIFEAWTVKSHSG